MLRWPIDDSRPLPGRLGVPTTDHPEMPASRRGLMREVTGVLQVPRLLLRSPRLARMPRGDGRIVVDMPGWRTREATMAPLRTYLRSLGHDARPWGLGANDAKVGVTVDRLIPVLRDLAVDSGRAVDLVGWSLGGVVAREAARRLGPEVVRQVVCFGSPIVGGPAFTAIGPRMSREQRRDWIERTDAHERSDPLRVPVTSIFTRRDSVVPWQASLDHHSEEVVHVEVASTHLTLGIDPDVWEIIARRLGAAA